MLNKKHNLKSGKKQRKKRDLKQKSKTGNQKKENIFQEKKDIAIENVHVVLFMNKSKEERKMKK